MLCDEHGYIVEYERGQIGSCQTGVEGLDDDADNGVDLGQEFLVVSSYF